MSRNKRVTVHLHKTNRKVRVSLANSRDKGFKLAKTIYIGEYTKNQKRKNQEKSILNPQFNSPAQPLSMTAANSLTTSTLKEDVTTIKANKEYKATNVPYSKYVKAVNHTGKSVKRTAVSLHRGSKLGYRITKTIFLKKSKAFVRKTVKETGKTVFLTAPKKIAKGGIASGKTVVKTSLKQGVKSTGFNEDTSGSFNAQAAFAFGKGKNDIESTIKEKSFKTVVKSPKKFVHSVKKANHSLHRSREHITAMKYNAKGMSLAVEHFKKGQHINAVLAKTGKQKAVGTLKNSIRLISEIIKQGAMLILRLGKLILSVISNIWWVILIVVIIIALLGSILSLLNSGYGIFLSADYAENEQTIPGIVTNVNKEYQRDINFLISKYDKGTVDLIRYEGKKTQWKYILAVYAVRFSSRTNEVITVDQTAADRIQKIFDCFHTVTAEESYEQSPYDPNTTWKVLTIKTETKTLSEVMDRYHFTKLERSEVAEILSSNTDEFWTALLYGIQGNSSKSFIKVAQSQIDQLGQLYTTWYGYNGNNAPTEWSGCFISWCANEVGYIEQGIFPQYSNSATALSWFQASGLWMNASSQPHIGDIIFIDLNGDGIADQSGIVSGITNNSMVKFITRGGSDKVVETALDMKNTWNYILGYGILPQMSGLVGDTVEEQCYNYLRADGYSDIAAVAVIANFQGECSCDPGIYSYDYGNAAGLMMWTGPNRVIFLNWCNDNAMEWTTLETQLNFFTYWLDVNNGAWGDVSSYKHPEFKHIYSTDEFKKITAYDYDGDIAKALYEATAMFVDDLERPAKTWEAETRRYTYAVQFYNFLVAGGVDGSSQDAWRPEYANDIGTFHLN